MSKFSPIIGKYKANDLTKYLNVDPELILNPHAPAYPNNQVSTKIHPRLQGHLDSTHSSNLNPDAKG